MVPGESQTGLPPARVGSLSCRAKFITRREMGARRTTQALIRGSNVFSDARGTATPHVPGQTRPTPWPWVTRVRHRAYWRASLSLFYSPAFSRLSACACMCNMHMRACGRGSARGVGHRDAMPKRRGMRHAMRAQPPPELFPKEAVAPGWKVLHEARRRPLRNCVRLSSRSPSRTHLQCNRFMSLRVREDEVYMQLLNQNILYISRLRVQKDSIITCFNRL